MENLQILRKSCVPSRNKVWVESPDDLAEMVEEILTSAVSEIAIDLEHHNIRSYRGFTCLIQISTRSQQFEYFRIDTFDTPTGCKFKFFAKICNFR